MCVKMILAYRPFIILFLFLNIHHLLSKITSCLEYVICGEISAYIMFFHTNISFYRESMPMHSQSNWNSIRMPISCQCRDIPKYINNNNCVLPLAFNVLWSIFYHLYSFCFQYIIVSIEKNDVESRRAYNPLNCFKISMFCHKLQNRLCLNTFYQSRRQCKWK